VIDFYLSDLSDCGLHHAIVWIVLTDEGCPTVDDFVSRFCRYFIYNNIIDSSGDCDANHLRPEVQSIKDEQGLRTLVADIAPLNDCMKSLPFLGFGVQVAHLEPEEIAVVDDDFTDGMYLSEFDDEVPFILRWECRQGFQTSIVYAGVVRFGTVGGTRYIFAVLCG